MESRLRKFLGLNQMGPETYQSVKALRDPNLRDEEALMRSQKGDKPVAASNKTDLEKMNAILGRGSVSSLPAQTVAKNIPKESVQIEEQVIESPQFAKPIVSEDDFEFEAPSEEELALINATLEEDKNMARNMYKERGREMDEMMEELIEEFGMEPKNLVGKSYDQIKRLSEASWRARKNLEDSLKSGTGGMFEDLQKQMKNRGK